MTEKRLAAMLREQEEAEARPLEERIEKTRRSLERYEKQLREIRTKYEELWLEEYRGGKKTSSLGEEGKKVISLPQQRSRSGQRIRRGSLDEPLLVSLKQSEDPIFTVPMVSKLWISLHPDTQVGRATIRVVLDRLVEQGHLKIIDPGGRGSTNPRQYSLKEYSGENRAE